MLDEAERLAGAGKTPIGEVLSKTLRAKNVEAAIRQYHDLKSAQPEAHDFSEEQLNYLGYRLMGMKQTKEAIKILRLNAEVYPKSANVYDSLGEAYMNDGDKEHAIENYEKSLQLDPGNKGAVEKLKQLRTR